jgi:hypothetical protein
MHKEKEILFFFFINEIHREQKEELIIHKLVVKLNEKNIIWWDEQKRVWTKCDHLSQFYNESSM